MENVLSFVRQHHMIDQGDHVLAAVSGGADSVCLLLVLLELQRDIPMELSVVHVEHGIRGAASRADADFVKSLCRRKEIPCYVYECDAGAYAKEHGMSLEEGARVLRYEYFETCKKSCGADKIAVAHNRNDCGETLLFHLARGTGLRGMRGILPVREEIIRPLLCLERREIEEYLTRQGQDWCTDDTNGQLVYSRNKIRHQVLPVLTEVNPQAVAHLGQAAQDMAEAWELVALETARARERWVTRYSHPVGSGAAGWEPERGTGVEGGVTGWLLLDGLEKELPLVQKALVQELLGELAGSRKDLGRVHLEQVLELFHHQVGHTLSLPYGLYAGRTYGGILLEAPGNREESRKIPDRELVPGQELVFGELGISIASRIWERNENFQEIPKKRYTKWFDYDKIKSGLLVRSRRIGDYLTVDAKGSRQSLKKYLVNQKVPSGQREELILVADGAHILWVVGYRISADYRVTEDTRHILEIQIHGGTIHE